MQLVVKNANERPRSTRITGEALALQNLRRCSRKLNPHVQGEAFYSLISLHLRASETSCQLVPHGSAQCFIRSTLPDLHVTSAVPYVGLCCYLPAPLQPPGAACPSGSNSHLHKEETQSQQLCLTSFSWPLSARCGFCCEVKIKAPVLS